MSKRAFLCFATLIGLTVASERPAHAALSLQLSDGVVSTAVIVSATNPVTFTGSVGRYDIVLSAGSSNSPGTSVNGRLEITNLTVTLNTANDTATRDLSINLSATDFSLPAGSPLSLDSSGSVTFTNVTAGAATWTFRSWADGTNSGAFQAGTATPGVAIVAPSSNPGSLSADDTAVEFTRGPLYSLSNLTTIRLLSLGASANTTGASVTSAIPEPGTLAMALASLPLLGLGYRLHRRRSRVI